MSLIVLNYSPLSYHVLITLFWVDCTVIGVNKKIVLEFFSMLDVEKVCKDMILKKIMPIKTS